MQIDITTRRNETTVPASRGSARSFILIFPTFFPFEETVHVYTCMDPCRLHTAR